MALIGKRLLLGLIEHSGSANNCTNGIDMAQHDGNRSRYRRNPWTS
ncbi:MAG: hypothetical protein Q4Q30_00375 [Eggerthella sp.]|nr:hypothetical protein [Eggerthella sp.]